MLSPVSQFVELWRRLSFSQRTVIVGAALATLGLLGAVIFYGSQPDYAVLFSDLKSSDAQAVVEKLKTAKVSYSLSSNGSTISVPSEEVSELRLQMAAPGTLSGGHVGFDIFDKSSFGATDFMQQVNYQRALEGELARTLEGLKEVESARVHITRSRESVFADKAEPAKASVMLSLRGRELPPERTEAIVSLLSNAVEGLEPDNISVMDREGRLLTSSRDKKSNKGMGMSDLSMDARRKFESETTEQIISLIEPVAGVGHVRANVAADIDFSQTEQTEENFDPKSAVIRTQQTSQEYKNSPSGPGGVAGTRANDPTAPPVQTPGNPATGIGRSATTVAYEISKVTKHTIGNGGKVSRLSVSVLVDGNPEADGQETAAAVEKIQQLVSAAVGIDKARGDQITVQTMPFQRPAPDPPPLPWFERNRDIVKVGVKYGVLAIIALLLLVFIIRPARRALQTAPALPAPLLLASAPDESLSLPPGQTAKEAEEKAKEEEESEPKPRTVAEMEAEAETESYRNEPHRDESYDDDMPPAPRRRHEPTLRDQVVEYTREDPERAAVVVRNWLQEP